MNDIFGQEDGLFRAGFLAITTENATEHVNLINGGIFFLAVKMLFTWFAFSAHHGDGFSRTGYGTQTAGSAAFTPFVITF